MSSTDSSNLFQTVANLATPQETWPSTNPNTLSFTLIFEVRKSFQNKKRIRVRAIPALNGDGEEAVDAAAAKTLKWPP
jgi:hypothetical protein